VTEDLIRRRREAIAIFKLGMKANAVGVHRTLGRPAKGKGWVQCVNSPAGIMCKPDKVRESIELFRKSYEILPDIAILNQIALAYEMLGELDTAAQYFVLMSEQAAQPAESAAEQNINAVYLRAADVALQRLGRTP